MSEYNTKLVVAAIDFGTTYSGYAYSFYNTLRRDPLKVYGNTWSDDNGTLQTGKAPTTVLFDPEGRFHSFGYDAERKYADLADDDEHIGWKYFKHFKMELHGKTRLRRDMKLTDDQGKRMFAIDVFAAAIRFLKDQLFEQLQLKVKEIKDTDIYWVITVPAIWQYSAKQFMKEASLKAGILADQFTFALEPEAAAIYCKQFEVSRCEDHGMASLKEFAPGTQFMVLDMGGGTVDITVSEVQVDGTLKELCPPSGGPWGGTLVDDELYKLFENIFGSEIWQKFKKDQKLSYLELAVTLELKKRQCKNKAATDIRILLPSSLCDLYKKIKGEGLDTNLSKGGRFANTVKFTQSKLRINNSEFVKLFESAKSQILEHLKVLLALPELKNLSMLMIVGGFSESAVIQQAVVEMFPDKAMIIPCEAGTVVMKGAVMYGFNKNQILSRKQPFPYETVPENDGKRSTKTLSASDEMRDFSSKNIVTVSGPCFSNLKEKLLATRTSNETLALNFEDPSEGMRYKLTSDVVNTLTEHAYARHDDKTMQNILLNNVSLGQKILQCSFSTDDLYAAKSILAERYTPRLACLHLFAPYLEKLDLDQADIINEADEFTKLIILDYICYSLVRTHENILEAYPSVTNDNIILIAFTKELFLSTNLKHFKGFRVLCKPYLANSSESIIAENYAQEQGLHCSSSQDFRILTEVIKYHTDSLFSKHSNLEGIGSSMVRSTRKGYDTASPCVVLYCRCKPYIPYGEDPFPASLTHQSGVSFKTDVRQGHFQFGPNGKIFTGTPTDWHKELPMGCSIGPNTGHYDATLGPFLNVEGVAETCFLTVRHMFQPFDIDDMRLQGTKIVQPAHGDIKQNPYSQTSQRDKREEPECGELLASIFNEYVDAAVVKIKADRIPSRGFFVVPTEKELKFAGFSFSNFPIFDDGSTLNAESMSTKDYATERIIKFGKTTGLTKGSFELNGMAVSVVDQEALGIQYNGRLERNIMRHQIKINSHSCKTFFQLGDSGSAVFLVDKRDKLHCIGMAIGAMSDLSCLVTPIQTILSQLERKLKKKIVVKKFELETMQ